MSLFIDIKTFFSNDYGEKYWIQVVLKQIGHIIIYKKL